MSDSLRTAVIRLAIQNLKMQPYLLPMLREAAPNRTGIKNKYNPSAVISTREKMEKQGIPSSAYRGTGALAAAYKEYSTRCNSAYRDATKAGDVEFVRQSGEAAEKAEKALWEAVEKYKESHK